MEQELRARLRVRAGELLAGGGGAQHRRPRTRVDGGDGGLDPRHPRRDRGAALRADLDRLMIQGIIPDRAARLAARERKQALAGDGRRVGGVQGELVIGIWQLQI